MNPILSPYWGVSDSTALEFLRAYVEGSHEDKMRVLRAKGVHVLHALQADGYLTFDNEPTEKGIGFLVELQLCTDDFNWGEC